MKRKTNGTKIINAINAFLNDLAEAFIEAQGAQRTAKNNYESAKKEIVTALDGKLTAETDKYVIAHVNNPKQMLDTARLKVERPDVYNAYLHPVDSWSVIVNSKPGATK